MALHPSQSSSVSPHTVYPCVTTTLESSLQRPLSGYRILLDFNLKHIHSEISFL